MAVTVTPTYGPDILDWVAGHVTEEVSITLLQQVRWPELLVCPRCAKTRIAKFIVGTREAKKRHLYQCSDCRYQYSVTVGTLFHNSHISLEKWFAAIWLLSNQDTKPTVQALHFILDISYKTAWKMAKRITREEIEGKAEIRDRLGGPDSLQEESDGSHNPKPLSGQIGPTGIQILGIRLRRILGPPPNLRQT